MATVPECLEEYCILKVVLITTTIDGSGLSNGSRGVLQSGTVTTVTVGDCNFTNNRLPAGAVIYTHRVAKDMIPQLSTL